MWSFCKCNRLYEMTDLSSICWLFVCLFCFFSRPRMLYKSKHCAVLCTPAVKCTLVYFFLLIPVSNAFHSKEMSLLCVIRVSFIMQVTLS